MISRNCLKDVWFITVSRHRSRELESSIVLMWCVMASLRWKDKYLNHLPVTVDVHNTACISHQQQPISRCWLLAFWSAESFPSEMSVPGVESTGLSSSATIKLFVSRDGLSRWMTGQALWAVFGHLACPLTMSLPIRHSCQISSLLCRHPHTAARSWLHHRWTNQLR